MKKVLFFVMTLLASAFIVPNAFAAAPEYFENFENTGKEMFFANGTEIVISARDDSTPGALITWEGGSKKVTANANVFGGNHNSDTALETSSITMNGGAVRNIFGGGLHKSYVKNTYIEINGGKLYGVSGGGASSLVVDTEAPSFYAGEAKNSPTKVDSAVVIINDGSTAQTGYSTIFGGGEGISYTKEAYVEINGGTWDWVTAAGANGATDTAILTVNGGKIAVAQGVNRGKTDAVLITVNDGEITSLYAGGETGDKDVTATFNEAGIMLIGGEIGSVSTGTNGGSTAEASDTTELAYNDEAFEERDFANSGFKAENTTTTVALEFIGMIKGMDEVFPTSTLIPKGVSLTEEEVAEFKAMIEEVLKGTDEEVKIAFKGFYTSDEFETEYDFTKAIEEDTTVYMLFEVEEEAEEEAPAVKNPETSDMNVLAAILVLLIGGTGLAYTVKNRKFN